MWYKLCNLLGMYEYKIELDRVIDGDTIDANIDLANDTGAVVIRCFMGNSVPDGIAATWNSVVYNRLTAADNHNGVTLIDGAGVQVDYAGIFNQGTGLPTYVGNQNAGLLTNSPYNSAGSCPTQGTSPSNFSFPLPT